MWKLTKRVPERPPTDPAKLRLAAAFSVHRDVSLIGLSHADADLFSLARVRNDDALADVIVLRDARDADGPRKRLKPGGLLIALDGDASVLREFAITFTVGSIAVATDDERWRHPRLHLGCGPQTLAGWINIDREPYNGVDFAWDLSDGIPFRDARFVFAEHFIEHLPYDAAAAFARACRDALSNDGVLRVSTPNLDWVWTIAYRPHAWTTSEDAQRDCFITNRAFRGWGHHFLYNAQTLEALLHNAGFAEVTFHAYGESGIPELRNLERHPRDADNPSLPHVIIAEARGTRAAQTIEGETFIAEYLRDLATK